jgi:hypothetical protein
MDLSPTLDLATLMTVDAFRVRMRDEDFEGETVRTAVFRFMVQSFRPVNRSGGHAPRDWCCKIAR